MGGICKAIINLVRRRSEFSGLYPVSMEWDAVLRDAIERGPIVEHKYNTVNVGGLTVWVGNYPYAFGRPEGIDVLPTLSTRKLLLSAVIAARIAEYEANK